MGKFNGFRFKIFSRRNALLDNLLLFIDIMECIEYIEKICFIIVCYGMDIRFMGGVHEILSTSLKEGFSVY